MNDFPDLWPLFAHGRMLWGSKHGYRWIPWWLWEAAMRLYNPIACRIAGHLWVPEDPEPDGRIACSYCCAMRHPA